MRNLPEITYEDQVGTRVTLVNYAHMADILIVTDPEEFEHLLSLWGHAIYAKGQKHEALPTLIHPLKVAGDKAVGD